jgi:hypothetical protein
MFAMIINVKSANLDLDNMREFTKAYVSSRGYALTSEELALLPLYFVWNLFVQSEFIATCNPEERFDEQSRVMKELMSYFQEIEKVYALVKELKQL